MLMVNLSTSILTGLVLFTDGFAYVYPWLIAATLLTALRLATGVYFKTATASELSWMKP